MVRDFCNLIGNDFCFFTALHVKDSQLTDCVNRADSRNETRDYCF